MRRAQVKKQFLKLNSQHINQQRHNKSLKLTLRTRRRFLAQQSTDLMTTYDTKQHFIINRTPRPQKHSQRSLAPVRYAAVVAGCNNAKNS